METYFLKNDDLLKFYERIAQEYELYVPVRVKSTLKAECECKSNLPTDDYSLQKFSKVNKEDIVFSDYRALEPARAFFTHYKEEACEYFENAGAKEKKEKPQALCGIKNCDLFSLKIQDFVFLGGNEVDPLYKTRRDNTLIISSDCPHFKDACFCRAFDINPYPVEGFDFNLSPLNNGYLLDVATPKAKAIAIALKSILAPATLGQLSGRGAKRESLNLRLDEHLKQYKIPKKEILQDIVLSGYNSGIWTEESRTCVECNGCVFMCDTCHCFLLADDSSSPNAKRFRLWDGCLLKNFTKVAGGGNALRLRFMRLRNRYLKKFDFFISNLGIQACCGCGRCIEVCPGKIDIRRILRKLDEEKHIPAA
jgi:formate hydrogenlyase subunit 6/NADH:ubiquinone oxidoreductase subunit I